MGPDWRSPLYEAQTQIPMLRGLVDGRCVAGRGQEREYEEEHVGFEWTKIMGEVQSIIPEALR